MSTSTTTPVTSEKIDKREIELASERNSRQYIQTLVDERIRDFVDGNIAIQEAFNKIPVAEAVLRKDLVVEAFTDIETSKLLTLALLALVPKNDQPQLLQVASYRIGLKVTPKVFKGRAVTPEYVAMVGGEVVRRLALLQLLVVKIKETTTHSGSEYIVIPKWEQGTADLINKLMHSRRLYPMLVQPAYYSKNRNGGALLKEVREGLRNKGSRLFTSAEDRKCINHLNSVARKLDLPSNEILSEYAILKQQQVMAARVKHAEEAVDIADTDPDSYKKIKEVQDFNADEFINALNYLNEVDLDNPEELLQVPFYVLHGMDGAGRKYERNGLGGVQQDPFMRSLVVFATPEKLTEHGRKWTQDYIDHIDSELEGEDGVSPKSAIKILGLTHRQNQLKLSLKTGMSRVPIELDANNSGIQVYACWLRSASIAKVCGMNGNLTKDAYNELVQGLTNALSLPKGLLTRSDGKKPVMTSIYGAGKKLLMLKGGDGWTGLYTLLAEYGERDGVEYLGMHTPDSLYDVFTTIMDGILPGVASLMRTIYSRYGGTVLAEVNGELRNYSKQEYVWTNPTGSYAVMRPLESSKFYVEVPSNDGLRNHKLELSTLVWSDSAKSKALAPLGVQGCDGSLLTWTVNDFADAGKDIMTVHDAYMVRANDCGRVIDSYKEALITLKNMDHIDRMLSELDGTPVDLSHYKANDLTDEMIRNGNPLSL